MFAGILLGGESVRLHDDPMDVGGALAKQMPGAMHEDFKQPDDAIIRDADACHAFALEVTRLAHPRIK